MYFLQRYYLLTCKGGVNEFGHETHLGTVMNKLVISMLILLEPLMFSGEC